MDARRSPSPQARARARAAVAGLTSLAITAVQIPVAHAQTAAAEALFREGQRLMAAGQVHDACGKFAESQRADPAIGTLINLALCHEKEGKVASAWTEYTDAASEARHAGQGDREQYAMGHAKALEAKIHHLVIDFQSPPANAEVKLDGEVFGLALLHTPVPVDPGEHTLEATAPGKKPWSKKLTVAGDPGTDQIAIPELANLPPEATPPAASGQQSSPLVPPPAEQSHTDKTKLALGYVSLGAGVIAAGISGYFAYRFVTYNNRFNDYKICLTNRTQNANLCANESNQNISDFRSQAITNQNIMLVSGGIAVVGLGVGAFLLLTASSGDHHAASASAVQLVPVAGAHESGLMAVGRF